MRRMGTPEIQANPDDGDDRQDGDHSNGGPE